jgi:iron complex transport system ATP-binding protein
VLRLNSVDAGYGAKNVLSKITLAVHPGEILAVIGLNGSGKSTLLRTMLGLLEPRSGEVLLEEKILKTFNPIERARLISLLDSKIQLNFAITIAELLDLGSLRHLSSKNFRQEALEAVGLQGYENKNLLELSSGEVKRALIAHTLCSGSKMILLDEPLANLDWSHQAELIQNLKRWQLKWGTTFVVAIHELDWAVKVSGRMCVLNHGEILFTGSPDEALLHPKVREVFAFHSRIDENPFDGSKQLILGRTPPSRAKKESELPRGFKK